MEPKDLIKKFQAKELKKGKFYKMIVEKVESNGYSRLITIKTRFVNYYNIASVKAEGKTPSTKSMANTYTIIPHILTYNTKTKNFLLHCYETPNSKTRVVYKNDYGVEITKEEFEMVNPPKKTYGSSKPIVRQYKVKDIIHIG